MSGVVPGDLLDQYEWHQSKHAAAILKTDFAHEFNDLIEVLREFTFRSEQVTVGGGGKSAVARNLDEAFSQRGWTKKRWDTKILVDNTELSSPTHEVDCYKNRVALEIEWNNKDPFYDRDLNNFRLLFDLRTISVGIIITKSDALKPVLKRFGVYTKYGTSTTWMHKLLPRIEGGGGGGCPLLIIGITEHQFRE